MRALLVLVPVAIPTLLLQPLMKTLGAGSGDVEQFRMMFAGLVVGLALLWLNAGLLGKCRGCVSFVLSLALVLLAAVVGMLSYGTSISGEIAMFLVFIVVMSTVLVTALSLARRLARGRYRPLRFLLHLAVLCMLITLVGVLAFIVATDLVFFRVPRDVLSVLLESAVAGVVAGLCLYAVNLPYLLLMFSSPFFRRRFQAWLGVQTAS